MIPILDRHWKKKAALAQLLASAKLLVASGHQSAGFLACEGVDSAWQAMRLQQRLNELEHDAGVGMGWVVTAQLDERTHEVYLRCVYDIVYDMGWSWDMTSDPTALGSWQNGDEG